MSPVKTVTYVSSLLIQILRLLFQHKTFYLPHHFSFLTLNLYDFFSRKILGYSSRNFTASNKSSFTTTLPQTSTLTHTPPPTPPTTHTTPIPDHLHEIRMRGGGQGWAVVKVLYFQGVRWCLKKVQGSYPQLFR